MKYEKIYFKLGTEAYVPELYMSILILIDNIWLLLYTDYSPICHRGRHRPIGLFNRG